MRLAIIIALSIALAGCSSDSETKDTPGVAGVEPTTSEPGSPVNGTVAEGNETAPVVQNSPPTANLTISAGPHQVGTEVLFTVAGNDTDGDLLNWTIDADGDGAVDGQGSLPDDATFGFTFTAAGSYVAVLNVTDGNASAEVVLQIEILEPAADGGSDFPLVYSQDILLSCPHCIFGPDAGQSSCLAVITDDQGLDCAFWEIPADAEGHAWTIGGGILATVEYHEDCSGSKWIDWDLDGAGIIPAGTRCIIAYDPVDPVITMVLTIE